MNGNRILIVKPSSLGDVVHTLPVVHGLKRCFPGCFIGWIIQAGYIPLVQADPAVDAVHAIEIPSTSDPHADRGVYLQALRATLVSLAALRRELRRSPYDLVLDLHGSFRSGLLGRANPGGRRYGFADARELNPLFQDERVAVPTGVEHAIEKNLLFLDVLGCKRAAEDFHLCCSPADHEEAAAVLAAAGIRTDRKVVYCNAAARWKTKFWPAAHWAELADLLQAQGVDVVFGGSRQDGPYLESIGRRMNTTPIMVAGRMGLGGLTALLLRSAVYVGLDSGPMHMAAMAGIPVVALFGPTHPERVAPYGVEHRILRNQSLDCLGCRRRSCSHATCMNTIQVSEVLQAVLEFIAS